LLCLSGCADSVFSTTQSIRPVERSPEGFASWSDATPAYQFAPADKVKVQFLLTPELNEDVVVGPDGMVGLRAAGQVQAGGRTATQLQADIAKAAAKTLTGPEVTVTLTDNPGALVFVGGSVTRSGAYALAGRHGTFEAVQLAGGFSPEARMDEVVVIRRDPTNRPMLRTVDLRSLVDGGDNHPDLPLVPGDIVFVPRNRISEVDLWIDQFITRFVPFSRAFNYTANRGGVGN